MIEIPGLEDLRLIGRGASAEVFVATQPDFDRAVAVKVLSLVDTDDEQFERFVRECRTIGRLVGVEGVVTPYFTGRTTTGQPYLAMEYLERGSVGRLLATCGPLTVPEVVGVGATLGRALTAAHDAGILHRDVKPDNVLIDAGGRVKLADFGIARFVATQGTMTATYTPDHVAPEILRGEPATSASDLYSLASTLWTCSEGRSPFRLGKDDDVWTIISRKLGDGTPTPGRAQPAKLAALLAAGLSPAARDRPTVEELTRDLGVLGPGRPIEIVGAPPSGLPAPGDHTTITVAGSTAPGPTIRTPKPLPPPPLVVADGRRRRAGAWITALVAVALLAAMVAAIAVVITMRANSGETSGPPTTVLTPTTTLVQQVSTLPSTASSPAPTAVATTTVAPVTTTPLTTTVATTTATTVAATTPITRTLPTFAPPPVVLPEPDEIEEASLAIASRYLDALAEKDWTTARALNPRLSSDDDQLFRGYRYLTQESIADYVPTSRSGADQGLRAVVVAYEDVPAGRQTSLYCFQFLVTPANGTLRSQAAELLRRAPGNHVPADFPGVSAECFAMDLGTS